jgi:hypothetical protein
MDVGRTVREREGVEVVNVRVWGVWGKKLGEDLELGGCRSGSVQTREKKSKKNMRWHYSCGFG